MGRNIFNKLKKKKKNTLFEIYRNNAHLSLYQ